MILLTKGPLHPIQDFEQEIISRLERGSESTLISIVPTQRKIREMQRRIAKMFQPRAIQLPFIVTLEEFARHLFRFADNGTHSEIDPAVQRVLFQSLLEKLSLEYFNPTKKKELQQGLIDKLLSIILGLKEDGVTPNNLRDDLDHRTEDTDVHEPKLIADLYHIYTEYEDALEKNGFVDRPGYFLELRKYLIDSPQLIHRAFPQLQVVLIEGFSEFRIPEREVIFLSTQDRTISVQLLIDYEDQNRELFHNLTEMVDFFQSYQFIKYQQTVTHHASTVEYIRNNLFQHSPHLSGGDTSISVIEAKNKKDEVQSVARIIKHVARIDPEFDLKSVCVAMYRPSEYSKIIRDECAAFGIPVNITDRTPLDQIPFIIALLGLLSIPVYGFRRQDILRTLSSPYFSFQHSPMFPPSSQEGFTKGNGIDSDNLRWVGMTMKIYGGKNSWREHLDDALIRLSQMSDEEMSGNERKRLQQRYEKAKSDIDSLISLFAPFEKELTPKEFTRYFFSIINKLCFEKNLLSYHETLSEGGNKNFSSYSDELERSIRAWSAFSESLESLMNYLDSFVMLGKSEPLQWFYPHIETIARSTKINIRERIDSGVLVTAIEETRGLDFQYMFVIGLTDGVFPSVYKTERFLGKELRKTESYHLHGEQFLFMQAITNYSKHLYCTYPRFDSNRENVRSYFVDALMQLVPVEQISTFNESDNTPACRNDLEEPRPAEMNEIATADDFFYQYGKLKWSDREVIKYLGAFDQFVSSPWRTFGHHVDKMIEVERSRITQSTLREYYGDLSGLFNNNDINDSTRPPTFSATQLETYGHCPFKYFSERVMLLKDIGEAKDGLEPLTRGSILHHILFDYFISRRRESLPALYNISQEDRHAEYERIGKIAMKYLRFVFEKHPFWLIDAREYFGVTEDGKLSDRILKAFIDRERETTCSLPPAFFEVRFGIPQRTDRRSDDLLYSDEPITFDNFLLQGKVDRIEMDDHAFVIVDYKTGKGTDRLKEIKAGAAFQLPLYIKAVGYLLAQGMKTDVKGFGGLYYLLNSPAKVSKEFGVVNRAGDKISFDIGKRSANILNQDEYEKLIDDSISTAQRYANEIMRGNFILQPNQKIDDVCKYCQYKRVCRIQLTRTVHEGEDRVNGNSAMNQE